MLRSLIPSINLLLLAGLAAAPPVGAAIFPDQLGGLPKTTAQPVEPAKDRAVWNEYGLELAEQASYGTRTNGFVATAWRLRDPTGALAAFQWQRPRDGRPSSLGALAVESRDEVLLAWHNYLFRFEGWKPKPDDLEVLYAVVPKLDLSALPTLPKYLPAQIAPNSERYVLGPAALEKFEPRIPPSVAAFHLSPEAQLAKVETRAGIMDLAIFSYPTPQIARQRQQEFSKLPGAMAKLTGPLVAVLLSPPDANEAERLLATIRYAGSVTLSERIPTAKDNVGDLLLNIFTLTGIIILMFIVTGVFVGLMRRTFRFGRDEDPMILLHLEDRKP